jgi:hypothetical protein
MFNVNINQKDIDVEELLSQNTLCLSVTNSNYCIFTCSIVVKESSASNTYEFDTQIHHFMFLTRIEIGLHVLCSFFFPDLDESWTLSTCFQNIFKHQISWKADRGSRVVLCGRTDGRTDMMKLLVSLRSFANASRNLNHLLAKYTGLLCTLTLVQPHLQRMHTERTVANEAVALLCTWRYSHSTSFTCIITVQILLCVAAVGSRM